MLAALAPASLARMRFPLGALTKPEVRAIAREAGLPVADKRDSQDLCFLAGTGKSAFLARHGGAARAARRDRRPRGADASAATAGSTCSRSASARGSASARRPSRSTSSPRTAAPTRSRSARARSSRRPRSRCATRCCTGRARRSTASSCATAPGRSRAGSRRAADGGLALRLAEPVDGAAPGQIACLMRGDVIVGHGVIASATRCQAATVAASAISPRRIIASNSGTAKRAQRRSCSVASGAGGTGFESGREPDVEALVGHAVREVERAEPLDRARRAARSPRPARRAPAPPPARPGPPPTRPAATPRSGGRRDGGAARRATRGRRRAGRSPPPAASRPRHTARARRRRARSGPRAAASSGSRRPARVDVTRGAGTGGRV